LVQTVAGEPHVVRQILRAIGPTDAAMLAHDLSAFARVEPLERADAAQRVPDSPRPRLVQHRVARP
jgi:hypothetical protein